MGGFACYEASASISLANSGSITLSPLCSVELTLDIVVSKSVIVRLGSSDIAMIVLPSNVDDEIQVVGSIGIVSTIFHSTAIITSSGSIVPTIQTIIVSFDSKLTSLNVIVIQIIPNTNDPTQSTTCSTGFHLFSSYPDNLMINFEGCSLTTSVVVTGTTSLTYNLSFLSEDKETFILNTTTPLSLEISNSDAIVINDVYMQNLSLGSTEGVITVSMFNKDRSRILIANMSTYNPSVDNVTLPTSPPVNNNYCTNPIIKIYQPTLSNFNGDVLEVIYDVMDGCVYDEINGCYKGCVSIINNGTRFTVFLLFINCTLNDNIANIDTNTRFLVIGYALVKLILARLIGSPNCCKERQSLNRVKTVFGVFDIKWLYRVNYSELIERIKCSRYNGFVKVLEDNIGLEIYFKYC